MKRITKSRTPTALRRWRRRQHGVNSSYTDLPGDVKITLHRKLLQEQGWLCGYTGLRVEEKTSHIEHIYPQTLCRLGAPSRQLDMARRDVDYRNLIAAFPKDDREWRDRYRFGAKTRGDWYDEANFVHPLRPDCEAQFIYKLNGRVEPADEDPDGPAAQTISHLALGNSIGDDVLSELRRAAIDELLFNDATPVSVGQVQDIQSHIYDKDAKGKYTQFCFVLDQACRQLLHRAEREHTRREAIRSQQKQK